MKESGPFWSAYQRVDDAAVIDFLTSTASVLADKSYISSKDTDNLRLALAGANSGSSERTRSLIVELDSEHAEYLDVLIARFGSSGLCLNLLRLTLHTALVETHGTLARLGQALLKKAELLFNRPFFIYQSGHCQRQVLYSSVIVDFVSSLAAGCERLQDCLKDLNSMAPSDLALPSDDDQAVDLDLAKSLGFHGLLAHSMPIAATGETKRKVAQILTLVGDAASHLAEQLTANTSEESAHDVVAACEWLKVEGQRLDLP